MLRQGGFWPGFPAPRITKSVSRRHDMSFPVDMTSFRSSWERARKTTARWRLATRTSTSTTSGRPPSLRGTYWRWTPTTRRTAPTSGGTVRAGSSTRSTGAGCARWLTRQGVRPAVPSATPMRRRGGRARACASVRQRSSGPPGGHTARNRRLADTRRVTPPGGHTMRKGHLSDIRRVIRISSCYAYDCQWKTWDGHIQRIFIFCIVCIEC